MQTSSNHLKHTLKKVKRAKKNKSDQLITLLARFLWLSLKKCGS